MVAEAVYGSSALKDRVLRLLRRRPARTIGGVDPNRDATLVLAEDVLRRLAQHEGVSW